ncbi:hypothetical protein L218DRAFT_723824 [Marasmius fiardii PR-910]|nr:hypothetical protein L218DRAFT_723824 [Marasmius fiardii PR-910]
MPFVYPPKGRPRRDSKGQVKEGEFDPLPDKWLIEMLMDFERGRLDLSTDLQQLSQVVKEASHQVLSLCAGIKNERKDTKIFLDAIEKICGNEILDQIKADARATVLASRNNLEPQSQTDNDLPQGRV